MTQPPAPRDESGGKHRDGLLIVDKPGGWSSHDVVARVRKLAGTRRVGHAGTLDPMATGVLVLGLNRATRLLHYLVGSAKEYEATIRLGQSTVTDDAEGDVTTAPGAALVENATLESALAALTGRIEQVPSAVSAVKVAGRRAYARVRSGEEVALLPRPVVVHRFELLGRRSGVTDDGTAFVDADVLVECSSGTYVRALARDLGTALGTGGHLVALRRTKVGPFTLDESIALDGLSATDLALLDVTTAARRCFRVRQLSDDEASALRYGRAIAPGGTGEDPVAAVGPEGQLVALVIDRGGDGERPARAHPVLVLDPA